MSYAQVTDGVITTINQFGLPTAARRLDTGQWVLGLRDAPVELQQACGWSAVVDVARPADTDTTTHDRTVELVNGTPTVVWTERPWTPEELTARTNAANSATLSDRATLDAKMAELKGFLADVDVEYALNVANSTPLTTQEQNRLNKAMIRQVRRVTNFEIRLARYTFGLLDDVTDI